MRWVLLIVAGVLLLGAGTWVFGGKGEDVDVGN